MTAQPNVIHDLKNSLNKFWQKNAKYTPPQIVPAVLTETASIQQSTEELKQLTPAQVVNNAQASLTSLPSENPTLVEAERFVLNDMEAKILDQELKTNSKIFPATQLTDAVETHKTSSTSDTARDGSNEKKRNAETLFAKNDSFTALLLTMQQSTNNNETPVKNDNQMTAPASSPSLTVNNPFSSVNGKKDENSCMHMKDTDIVCSTKIMPEENTKIDLSGSHSEITKKVENSDIAKTSLAVHDSLLYLDDKIQSLLRIMLNQPYVHIMAAQSPNLNSEFKNMYVEVLLNAIINAKENQITTVIPLNTVRQAALDTNGLSQNAGDHWVAVSVKLVVGAVLIKFIDPLGSVNQISTVVVDNKKYQLPSGKVEVDYKISNVLTRVVGPKNLTLAKNAEDFLELLKKDLIPRIKNKYTDLKLQVIITGIIQQTNSVDCGAYIVKDLVDDALDHPLTKESSQVLRQQHEMMLRTQLDNAESHPSYSR